MNEKEKAEQRFGLSEDNIKMTLLPQCLKCELNIDRVSCQAFDTKPVKYLKNLEECPQKR